MLFSENFMIRCNVCNNVVVCVTTENNKEGNRKTLIKCRNKKCNNREVIVNE